MAQTFSLICYLFAIDFVCGDKSKCNKLMPTAELPCGARGSIDSPIGGREKESARNNFLLLLARLVSGGLHRSRAERDKWASISSA